MPENESIGHSEEAQEILGKIPGWIVRRGITLIFIIFLGIAVGCYFIKYPQTVIAPIVITTINPPADLIVRTTGRIDQLFVQDGNFVNRNEIVALLYNTADYNAICLIYDSLEANRNQHLKDLVNSEWILRDYQTGELQSFFLEFKRLCLDYNHYLSSGNIEKKKELISQQIKKNKEYYQKQLAQRKTLDREIYYESQNLERDSMLHSNNVISKADYEQSIRSLLQKESTKENFEAGLTNTELSILQKEQQLIELSIQKDNEVAEYERLLSNALQQLVSQIRQWRYQYLIVSPIEGRVTYTKYWSNNQTIQVGERIASVIPKDSMQVIGRLSIPTSNFGKVEVGQTVNIKLNGYPYMEFGMLKGEIRSLSDVPDENGYIAEVVFPNGLLTTYKKKLNLIQRMDGAGEIITQDQRLIQRFLQPVRALFDK